MVELTRQQPLKERDEIIAMMRKICAEYGDNDWPDALHPADVLEKHLYCHLTGRRKLDGDLSAM